MALKTCPNCGKLISDKAKVCPKCGMENPFEAEEAQIPISAPEESEATQATSQVEPTEAVEAAKPADPAAPSEAIDHADLIDEPKRGGRGLKWLIALVVIMLLGGVGYYCYYTEPKSGKASDTQCLKHERELLDHKKQHSEFDLGYVHMGKNEGLINNKYKIVMEVTSVDGNKIMGNIYYPSIIEKYGNNSDAYMPFSGEFGCDERCYFSLNVKSRTDKSYRERWYVTDAGGYMSGTIYANNGKEMGVVFK